MKCAHFVHLSMLKACINLHRKLLVESSLLSHLNLVPKWLNLSTNCLLLIQSKDLQLTKFCRCQLSSKEFKNTWESKTSRMNFLIPSFIIKTSSTNSRKLRRNSRKTQRRSRERQTKRLGRKPTRKRSWGKRWSRCTSTTTSPLNNTTKSTTTKNSLTTNTWSTWEACKEVPSPKRPCPDKAQLPPASQPRARLKRKTGRTTRRRKSKSKKRKWTCRTQPKWLRSKWSTLLRATSKSSRTTWGSSTARNSSTKDSRLFRQTEASLFRKTAKNCWRISWTICSAPRTCARDSSISVQLTWLYKTWTLVNELYEQLIVLSKSFWKVQVT